VPGVRVPDIVSREWPAGAEVTVDVSSTGERAVAIGSPDDLITEHGGGRDWLVPVGGFWQVHVGAADVLTAAVLDFAAPHPDDGCLDLYSGVGLFAGALATRTVAVTAVESDGRAVEAARRNLVGYDVQVVRDRVDRFLHRSEAPADVVVLDPPRKGAGREVTEAIAARDPRVVVYVACDPAALARDLATFAGHGYQLTALRAFDLFPMTAHVECVARITR
jgi:tRNA/tmRNA/rRNA uracil-C5-methylase (TrmA/RlmC/RlmD family)